MTETANDVASELKTWKEIHSHLSHAILVAREAVDVAKAQRRYWLEEIAANITDEGKLTAASVWKKPTTVKKTSVKKRSPKEKKEKPEKKRKATTDDDNLAGAEGTRKPSKKPKTTKKKKKAEPGSSAKKSTIKLNLKERKADQEEQSDVDGQADFAMATEHVRSGWGGLQPTPQIPLQSGAFVAPAHAGLSSMPAVDAYSLMHHIPEQLRPFLAQPGMAGLAPPPPPPPTAGGSLHHNAYATVLQHQEDGTDDDSSEGE